MNEHDNSIHPVKEEAMNQVSGGAFTVNPVCSKCGSKMTVKGARYTCPCCGETLNDVYGDSAAASAQAHRHGEGCKCGSCGSSSSSSWTK